MLWPHPVSQFIDGAAAKIGHLPPYDIEHATMIVAEHAWIALVVTIATSLAMWQGISSAAIFQLTFYFCRESS
jgi:hypothetical protein